MNRCFPCVAFLKASCWLAFGAALLLTTCGRRPDPPRAPFMPLADLERTYGHLITVGNHPTPDQNGTGDRVGFFLDDKGQIWGLPLNVTASGDVLACAPPAMHDAKVTDTYPSGDAIVGSRTIRQAGEAVRAKWNCCCVPRVAISCGVGLVARRLLPVQSAGLRNCQGRLRC
jgi:hypothetical protein